MKDARRKARVDAFVMEQLEEVFLFARPGPCAPPFPGRFCLMIRLFYFIKIKLQSAEVTVFSFL